MPQSVDSIAKYSDSISINDFAPLYFPPLHSIKPTSLFGLRYHPILHIVKQHNGIDLQANDEPVYAFADGTIENAAWDNRSGFYVVIRHTESLETVYAHLSYICVHKGEYIKGGSMIAYSGSSGLSTGPHLHFGLKYRGEFIDPLDIFTNIDNSK